MGFLHCLDRSAAALPSGAGLFLKATAAGCSTSLELILFRTAATMAVTAAAATELAQSGVA